MVLAKIVLVLVACVCVFVYFSDFLIEVDNDINSTIKQTNVSDNMTRNISEFVGVSTINPNKNISRNIKPADEFIKADEKEDFINQISLIKISDRINTTSCLLPHLDPWDSIIRSYLNPNNDPLKTCKPSVKVRSFISDTGDLDIIEVKSEEKCSYRCVYAVDENSVNYGEWTDITEHLNETILTAKPKCDVFDVKCLSGSLVVYKYLHSQIYEKNPKTTPSEEGTKPYDMHMIVLDSVSMSQLFRSLPMTVHFIRNELDAIPVPFLNKIGVDSRANGYAFLMNERSENLVNSPWSKELKGGRSEELCHKSLNDETFIGYDFQKNGYRTMINEDWSMGIFTYPDCKGFSKPPVDHFLKPYLLRVGSKNFQDSDYKNLLYKNACKEKHQYVLRNLHNFMLKYPNEPKFSLNWITDLAHDDPNGVYHADLYFREFFRRMVPNIKNSFVFFMGDHGGRTGKIRNSALGVFEDNNPALFVILPENLRKNRDLYDQLHLNSKELIVHYDLYATMMEIATTSSKWNLNSTFSNVTFETSERTLKGSSIFHKLKQPRDCNSLLIPYNYCNCQHPSEVILGEKELGIKIGQKIVEKINKEIKESTHASQCAELTLDTDYEIGLREYDRGAYKDKRIMKAHLGVKPSGGLYEGFVEVRGNEVILIDEKFPRLNMYKEQAFCIPQKFMKNYCYCTSLLEKSGRKRK